MILKNLIEWLKAYVRIFYNCHKIRVIQISPALRNASHVVILIARNDYERLPFFIEYYRRMGFGSFVYIDNDSSDKSVEWCLSHDDISVFSAKGSYKNARFGNDWINFILMRYCHNKWILYVDTDEFLIFPEMHKAMIQDLTAILEKNCAKTFPVVMVDMYSENQVGDNIVSLGQNPLEVCSLFDGAGYEARYEKESNTTWIKGGVRSRLFFSQFLWDGPALNKIPLVKWKSYYAFIKSSHQLVPLALNKNNIADASQARGAVLHFKFLSSLSEKVKEEALRMQHTMEYRNYRGIIDKKRLDFKSSKTKKFVGWRSAYDLNIMQEGVPVKYILNIAWQD